MIPEEILKRVDPIAEKLAKLPEEEIAALIEVLAWKLGLNIMVEDKPENVTPEWETPEAAPEEPPVAPEWELAGEEEMWRKAIADIMA